MSFPAYARYKESGSEWLGQVPSHWEVLNLERITVAKCDGPFGSGLKSEHYADEGVRVVRLQNIRAGAFNAADAAYVSQAYYDAAIGGHEVVEGDLLLAGLGDDRNLVGRACVAPSGIEPAMVKADCFRFRLDGRRATTSFVAQQLTAGANFDAGVLSSGSTRSRIPLMTMATRKVALPPLPEQTTIADFLGRETAKIDALVEAQRRLIDLLKEKRQAVISHAIAKGLDCSVPMKTSGVAWPAEVPAHWQVLPLTRVVTQFVDYRGKTPEKVDEGVPLITATQIKNGKISHHLDPVFISEEEYSERMTRGFPQRGDLLLTTEAPLGEVALIEEERVAPGQRIILMKVNKERITSRYLFNHYRSKFGQQELWTRASGTTASGIRSDRLRAGSVLVPPIEEQHAIVGHIEKTTESYDAVEAVAEAQVQLLQERRAALIASAVTGKIDVRGLVQTVEAA